jgi:DNA-binding response OmpR family regulator
MPRILVVDDDHLIRTLLSAIFEMHGIECAGASGGQEALRRLATERFDLVLLDLMMPGTDGFGVLDALETIATPHPPIMIATAASPHVVDRVPASRIAAILAKPFDVDELIATARELLRRAAPAEPPEVAVMNDTGRHTTAVKIVRLDSDPQSLSPRTHRRPRV